MIKIFSELIQLFKSHPLSYEKSISLALQYYELILECHSVGLFVHKTSKLQPFSLSTLPKNSRSNKKHPTLLFKNISIKKKRVPYVILDQNKSSYLCIPLFFTDLIFGKENPTCFLKNKNSFGILYANYKACTPKFSFSQYLSSQILGETISFLITLAEVFSKSKTSKKRLLISEEFSLFFATQLEFCLQKIQKQEDSSLWNPFLTSQLEEKKKKEKTTYPSIIGKSPSMVKVYQLLDKIAHTSLPILIYGKSGTGKELVAKAIHQNSSRKNRILVNENCGAITESLVESEFFGHLKGAFTGAQTDKMGIFQYAHGGTLFLDEIGEMSLPVQKKFLRVLEKGIFRPIGSLKDSEVDVRIIVATNQNLKKLVAEKKFREDLYFRLKGLTVNLPSLSERMEDIPLLLDYFLEKISKKTKSKKKKIDIETLKILKKYPWPGNVRELKNEITRLTVLSEDIIYPTHISSYIYHYFHSKKEQPIFNHLPLKEARFLFEKQFIQKKLDCFRNNITKTASELGITRQHLYRLIDQYKLSVNRTRKKI